MAKIPVWVQKPNKPSTARQFGFASDQLDAEEVARLVGVPEGFLLEGKVIRYKGSLRWSLVADVKFVERER